MKSTFELLYMTFFSQARRTCGTTHFIRPCTILHATGLGLAPNFEDCEWGLFTYSKILTFFKSLIPSYLSDHVQIVVHLYCNISLNEKSDNALHSIY